MSWHDVLTTQGPLALGALLRFAMAWLNARSNRMAAPAAPVEEGE